MSKRTPFDKYCAEHSIVPGTDEYKIASTAWYECEFVMQLKFLKVAEKVNKQHFAIENLLQHFGTKPFQQIIKTLRSVSKQCLDASWSITEMVEEYRSWE